MSTDIARLQSSPREVARWQKAQQQLLGGRRTSVVASYRDLLLRYPGVAQLWFEMGIAAGQELNFALANQAFERAVTLAPKDAQLLILIGQQYHRLRRLDEASKCFEQAVAADPTSVHARLSLAAWYERERRLDDAWECVEACVADHPRNAQALCVRALLLQRKGRSAEAETLLHDLIKADSADPNIRFSSRHLLGVVLDEMGQYSEAMRWLGEAKKELRRSTSTAAMEQSYDRADRFRRELLAALTPETIRGWREESATAVARHRLAFLGGHPRSGTTLLERILGAHPGLLAFDESEAFANEIWDQLAPMQATQALTLGTLNGLTASHRAELSRNYFKSLLREAPGESRTGFLLDKNPSPTASLHLILRIFPELKVIIALRDPRDVLISCFFQNLMLTPTNANFLSLERTAKHYADLMDVWLRLRELGGFDWIETRYEDVVSNLEVEGKRVTEFLGLTWLSSQAAFHEKAAEKFVYSPTFNEVAKPVHQKAVGRWQNYAEALEPLQERLAPYCRAFGYSV